MNGDGVKSLGWSTKDREMEFVYVQIKKTFLLSPHLRMAHDPVVDSPESSDLTSGSTLSPPKHKQQISVSLHLYTTTKTQTHVRSLSLAEVTYLGISSFDVVKCPLWQFDQLCVSDSMDSGGSRLSGQGLHLKHIIGHMRYTSEG